MQILIIQIWVPCLDLVFGDCNSTQNKTKKYEQKYEQKKRSMMKCYSFIYEKLLISSQTETFLINSSPGQNKKETRKK